MFGWLESYVYVMAGCALRYLTTFNLVVACNQNIGLEVFILPSFVYQRFNVFVQDYLPMSYDIMPTHTTCICF